MSFTQALFQSFRYGSNLLAPPDQIPEGGVRLLENARLTRLLGVISSRAGMRQLTDEALQLAGIIRSLWTLFRDAGDIRYAQVGELFYRLAANWSSPTQVASDIGVSPVAAANMVDGEEGLWAYFTNISGLGQYKDDGTTWTLWGIAPPAGALGGATLATDLSTTINVMDSAALWTVVVGLTAGPTDETNIKQQGTGSVTITVAANTLGSIAQGLGGSVNLDTLTGGDATVKDDDYIHLDVRADRPDRIDYLQLDFDLDTATVANAFRNNLFSIQLPATVWLNQGANQWSKVQVAKSRFTRAGSDTTLTWAYVKSVRISVLTMGTGACQLYFDDFKLRGGTDITGMVRYAACYRNGTTGARGNPRLDSDGAVVYTTALKVDRQRVNVVMTNTLSGGTYHPSDAQITQMRLYRSIDEGEALQIAQFADTATSPYLDSISVASTVLANVLETDNDRPRNGHLVFGPGNLARLFMIVGTNNLYFSKAWEIHENRAENWPPTFHVQIGDGSERARVGIVSDSTVLVWSDQRTYMVQGTGEDTFVPLPVPNSTGIVGRYALTEGDGRLFFVALDGVYEQRGMLQVCISHMIAPFFAGITVSGQAGWNTDPVALLSVRLAWQADVYGPFLLMLYPSTSSNTPDRELYLGKNIVTGQYSDASFDRRGGGVRLRELYRDSQRNQLYAGGDDGHVYWLEDQHMDTDHASAIPVRIVTKSEHHGKPEQDKSIAEAFAEVLTNGALLTCTALYDQQVTPEVLSTQVRTLNSTSSVLLPTADPEAMHQDMALELEGTVSVRIDIARYGWQYELQPALRTFWDSGVISWGTQTLLQGLWYTLLSTDAVTVRLYFNGAMQAPYTIPSANGKRVASRFFVLPGTKGRQMRVTLSSPQPFRLYGLRGRWKPYGAKQAYKEASLLEYKDTSLLGSQLGELLSTQLEG